MQDVDSYNLIIENRHICQQSKLMFMVGITANKVAHTEINLTNYSKTDIANLLSDRTHFEHGQKLDSVILAIKWSMKTVTVVLDQLCRR